MCKCSECGFLSLRNQFTGQLDDVDSSYRETGRAPRIKRRKLPVVRDLSDDGLEYPYDFIPICFAQAANLASELDSFELRSPEGVVSIILNKERDHCPGYTKWQQGFTPKEHREMLDRERLLKDQREQRAEDRRWRIIELVVVGVLGVLAAGGFTILGAFIQRGH